MPGHGKARAARGRISRAEVQKIAEQMRSLPPPREAPILTKQAAIEELSGEIKALVKSGYTLQQIADWLRENTPLHTTAMTIKSALSGMRRRVKSEPKLAEKPLSGEDKPREVAGNAQPGAGTFAIGDDEV